MKYNKLLVLALPLLLAISACNNSGSKTNPSEMDSVYSEPDSSETPSSEFEEEPLPVKTPEELEEEAWGRFDIYSEVLSEGDFYIRVESDDFTYTRYHYVADGYVAWSQNAVYDFDNQHIESYILAGYMANSNGVFRVRSRYTSSEYRAYPAGYVMKSSYDQAKAYVNGLAVRMPFTSSKWQYLGNFNGSSAFKSVDQEVIKTYSFYENGYEVDKGYNAVYASISDSADTLVLSAETKIDGFTSFMYLVDLKLDEFLNRGITRDNSYSDDDYRRSQFAEIIRRFRNIEISDDSWYRYEDINAPLDYVPFPENGNRYYFIDPDFTNLAYYNNGWYSRIGFIDTGDMSSDYRTQLLNNGYELMDGETNKFYTQSYRCTVELEFVPANETSRPDVYTKGIFYIVISLDH